VARFLERYGHRSFSLDIYDPPWEADLPGFLAFLRTVTVGEETAGDETAGEDADTSAPLSFSVPGRRSSVLRPPSSVLLAPLVRLTRDYLRLREAQRFHWQQLLALQRRVALRVGRYWAERGLLAAQEDVFGMTWQELMSGEPERAEAAARMAELRRLRKQAAEAPSRHYPEFLRGNHPLRPVRGEGELRGQPVSPGVARGRVRLVAHPGDFTRLMPGDILVTTSPDPGWTPVYATIAGMVTERGGQLSHGAVVAREYGLPAVSRISGAMQLFREGEMVLVDGTEGVVVRVEEGWAE
jgi:pyruvate,water dikinase